MEAVNWGQQLVTRGDNSEARAEPDNDSAYVQVDTPGVSGAPRRFKMPDEREPVLVWVIVVGSIAALFLFAKAFKSATA